jgi:two-component system phosphate regulon sensor histidine kinase PhoR
MFRSIRWRIAIPYVLLILAVMAFLVVYLSSFVREVYLQRLEAQLLAEATMVRAALEEELAAANDTTNLDPAAYRYARLLNARVTIIGADGTVLGDSDESRITMDSHLYRSEIQQALAQGQGRSIRRSTTMGFEMMYVAVRVTSGDEVVGFARVALPLGDVNAQVAQLRTAMALTALVVTLLAALLAVFIAERTARPVRRLTRVAERLAEGDLNARLLRTTRDEVGQLTDAFNYMAHQLREKVTTLAEEQHRLEAILDAMAGGVIITDGEGRVRLINPAAARLLNMDQGRALGLSLAQVVRHHELIELWQRCRKEREEQSAAIEIGYRNLFVQAIVKPFGQGKSSGYLTILQDLTRVRRLETVRRDFISNISHELRTPLAGLKALVDTLRGGALEDPPAAQRFLDSMEGEVDALTQMVEELLELSRIESGRMPLRLRPTEVSRVVIQPVERLRPQAERAGLTMEAEIPPDLPSILAEEERVQQVVTNLVHNAIKFTPAGGRVQVTARAWQADREGGTPSEAPGAEPGTIPAGDWVIFSVQDTGVGIPADDLPRIFERFYKADRARSGGGTGLGLAIAKHIVQSHGGAIWADSVEGKGSTFYFCIPVA